MGLFQELKRRNVIRVGLAYVLAAWVILQIVDFVLEVIVAPDWILQVFVLAAAVGLPMVLIIAWVFEMTPEGIKRESQIDRSQSITPQTGHKLDRVIIASLAVAVVFLLVDKFVLTPTVTPAGQSAAIVQQPMMESPPTPTAAASPMSLAAKSVAVLPFVAMSQGIDDEYFADGVTEEILNSLAQLPELLVTARTSSFAFKGQDVPVQEIATKLGVRHIVEGSVRRSGERLRVTAQLIRAEDGFHLWSDNFDGTSGDTILLQESIAEQIAVAMDVVLDESKRASMRKAGLRDVEAFIAYQKGVDLYEKAHGADDQVGTLLLANEQFEFVQQRVPDFSPAYWRHSDAYLHILLNDATGQPMDGVSPEMVADASDRLVADFRAAIEHARTPTERNILEIDQAFVTGNWRGVPARIERWLGSEGCDSFIWIDPMALVLGYRERLAMKLEATRQCNPLAPSSWLGETRAWIWSGDPVKSLEVASRAADQAPSEWISLALVLAHIANGQFDAAEVEIDSRFQVPAYQLVARVAVAAGRGDRQQADRHFAELMAMTSDNGFWNMLGSAWRGDRETTNRLAARVDQHVFGNPALSLLFWWCACGSPWDLEATPNFADMVRSTSQPWPPESPINFPLKDW